MSGPPEKTFNDRTSDNQKETTQIIPYTIYPSLETRTICDALENGQSLENNPELAQRLLNIASNRIDWGFVTQWRQVNKC